MPSSCIFDRPSARAERRARRPSTGSTFLSKCNERYIFLEVPVSLSINLADTQSSDRIMLLTFLMLSSLRDILIVSTRSSSSRSSRPSRNRLNRGKTCERYRHPLTQTFGSVSYVSKACLLNFKLNLMFAYGSMAIFRPAIKLHLSIPCQHE